MTRQSSFLSPTSHVSYADNQTSSPITVPLPIGSEAVNLKVIRVPSHLGGPGSIFLKASVGGQNKEEDVMRFRVLDSRCHHIVGSCALLGPARHGYYSWHGLRLDCEYSWPAPNRLGVWGAFLA